MNYFHYFFGIIQVYILLYLFFFQLSYALFFGMGAIKEKLNLYRAIYEDRIQKLFKNLGSFLSKHPRKTLICCIIVNILLALGILNIEFQYDVETLYIPQDSKSLKDRNNLEFKHCMGIQLDPTLRHTS